MVDNNLFQERVYCPVCSNDKITHEIDLSMKHPSIKEFQKNERFYSDKFLNFYDSNNFPEINFRISNCNKCKMYFNSLILNNEGMNLLYNEWLDQDKLNEYYRNLKSDINEKFRIDFLDRYYNKKINVLDFGAGFGNFLKLAKDKNFTLFAFELSEEKKDYLKNSLGVNVLSDLTSYKNFFHFINLNQVIEHIDEPAALLKELVNCLTDDGIIFISSPNCKKTGYLLRQRIFTERLWLQLSPFQHINAFNNRSLKLIGKKSGFIPFNFIKMLRYLKLSKNELIFFLKQIYHFFFTTNLYFKKNKNM